MGGVGGNKCRYESQLYFFEENNDILTAFCVFNMPDVVQQSNK